MTNPEKFGGMYDGGDPVAGAGHPADAGNPVPAADKFEVPTVYAEKGWAKDLTSYDDVFKKLDGSQELIGKKAFPDANATPEQWDEHYKAIGKPEDAGKYNFNRESFSKEFQEAQNEEVDNVVKAIFHKAGLQQRQVDIIQPEVEKLAEALQTQKTKDEADADKVFDELANKTFGTNKDQIIADTAALLKENTPQGFEQKIGSLDNETLIILSGVLNTFKEKYINEDGSGSGQGGNAAGETVEDLRIKARTLMQSEEYRNSFNPASSNKRKEVAAIYEKIAKLQS